MTLQKINNYRNPALLALAKHGTTCMNCERERPLMMAHSNQGRDGKGMRLKAHDYRIAMLCLECHMEIDSGVAYTRLERIALWENAHRKTIAWLFEGGYVDVVRDRQA